MVRLRSVLALSFLGVLMVASTVYAGGEVVAMGAPVEIIANGDRSHTAQYLRAFLSGGDEERREAGW